MKTRSTEEIIRHALQKELSVLSRAKDKARQTSEDYINAPIRICEISKETLEELDKQAPCFKKLEALKKRMKYLNKLTKKNHESIFDNELRTRQEHDALDFHLNYTYRE